MMPKRDGTGPMGMGASTGWGRGNCANGRGNFCQGRGYAPYAGSNYMDPVTRPTYTREEWLQARETYLADQLRWIQDEKKRLEDTGK